MNDQGAAAREVALAYDATLRRPACMLVAAGMGGSTDAANLFPAESWLLAPTPAMRVYQTTPDQLRHLVALALTRIPEGNDPSISPDAGQNRQLFSTPGARPTTLEEGSS